MERIRKADGSRRMTETERREHREYLELVKSRMPKSRIGVQCLRAFLVGGAICTAGQLISEFGLNILKLSEKDSAALTSIIMIFIAALLTGVGVYDKLGSFAGAGSAVPITGFANSIVSSAMEHRREGLVMGIGAQLFTIAGPVLVYGITSSVIIGILTLVFG